MVTEELEKEIQKINSAHSSTMLIAMANEDIDAMKVEMELYVWEVAKLISTHQISLEYLEVFGRLFKNDCDAIKLMEATKGGNIYTSSPSQVWSDIGIRLAKGTRQVVENELG